ncbi:MAG: ATP-dependent DNA helicase RecG [Alcaligenaceae bacterium]|nr:ATP-dependent DNA helicase RecG [Alcaligenaceae bacterium]
MNNKTPSIQRNSKPNVFQRLGLERPWDFLFYLPLRYEDRTKIFSIDALEVDQFVQLEGELMAVYPKGRILQGVFQDETGEIFLNWFQKPKYLYPFLQRQLNKKTRLIGQVEINQYGDMSINHPQFESCTQPLKSHLTPIYPLIKGLTQSRISSKIQGVLKDFVIEDYLSDMICKKYDLMPLKSALHGLHYVSPNQGLSKVEKSLKRLKFDEFLAQQVQLNLARIKRQQLQAYPMKADITAVRSTVLERVGFSLTSAQDRVIQEIAFDLSQSTPMLRLLQGDVGSGKTLVCLLASLKVILSGAQVALMAPTEILAEQHFNHIHGLLSTLGICVVYLTGQLKASQKKKILSQIETGEAQFVIGTQALIQKNILFNHLGMLIVDEQHRFGVQQRIQVKSKNAQYTPHQLNMSATPIPRTLALSYLADLDVSVIDELPPGRTPVQTRLFSMTRRDEVISALSHVLAEKRQVYWVCPLVEESELIDLQNVQDTCVYLQSCLPNARVGSLHGRMSVEDKNRVMEAFRLGELDLLVSTTVIEVGVDVPNASFIVIEQAERFGLAQLHQLRGRVGRGAVVSDCVLLYQGGNLSPSAKARLKAMRETTDGFVIAQRDLEIRGAGEILGLRQSGTESLRFLNLTEDFEIIRDVQSLISDVSLYEEINLSGLLSVWYREAHDYIKM